MIQTVRFRWVDELNGGLTAAVIALPLALAFGVVAFAPMGPAYAAHGALTGLLGAVYTGFFASLFGGTPSQVTGPTGPMTVIATAVIAETVQRFGHDLNTVMLCLSVVIIIGGLTQLILGVIKGGRLIKFVPYPVVAGFMNGIAIIIFISQIPPFLGMRDFSHLPQPDTLLPATIVGTGALLALLLCKKHTPKLPSALIALLVGVVIYQLLALLGIAPSQADANPLVIGPIVNPFADLNQLQQAMPLFQMDQLPQLPASSWSFLLFNGMALGLLGALDSLLTSLVADSMTRGRHHSDHELRGQGIANIVSALGGGLAGAGATVRTLVNIQAGGRTPVSGMIHALCILLVTALLSNYAAWIPLAALAGILFYTAVTMIDYKALQLIRNREVRHEFLIMLLVTGLTVAIDLMVAVGVGCGIALLLFTIRLVRQPIVHERIRGNELFSRNFRSPEEMSFLQDAGQRTLIYSVQAHLFFGTVDALVQEVEQDWQSADRFLFDFSAVREIDLTGVHIITSLVAKLLDAQKEVHLCGLPHMEQHASPHSVRAMLEGLGGLEDGGEVHLYHNLDLALDATETKLLASMPKAAPKPSVKDHPAIPKMRHLLEPVWANMQVQTLAPGEKLTEPGTALKAVCLVCEGEISVFRPTPSGLVRISKAGPGVLVGLRALFEETHTQGSSLVAEQGAKVRLLPIEALHQWSLNQPQSYITFQKAMLRAAISHYDMSANALIWMEHHRHNSR
ncbi:SLC26A/SulP transporter family protein [Magnetococcus sp. PR-3]|uniref:SLC26A/SulP transporter family protein n=1 Tax=Magnetococcus sp. PR-3 TaxID=3120355 RepID=UPI002FCE418D